MPCLAWKAMGGLTESIVEGATLFWFWELGYTIGHWPQIVTLRDTLLPKLLSGELSVALPGNLHMFDKNETLEVAHE